MAGKNENGRRVGCICDTAVLLTPPPAFSPALDVTVVDDLAPSVSARSSCSLTSLSSAVSAALALSQQPLFAETDPPSLSHVRVPYSMYNSYSGQT